MRIVFLIALILSSSVIISAQETTPEVEATDTTMSVRYTYHQATGNRFVDGTGTFPNVTTTDTDLPTLPQWVIGSTDGWYVALADDTQLLVQDTIQAIFTPQIPSVLALVDEDILASPANYSALSHPVRITENGQPYIVGITNTGSLQLTDSQSGATSTLDLNIQPDARIVVSDDNRIAVYASATNERYVHAIMGDDLEGSELVVLRITDGALEIIERIMLDGDAVYEGLSPMWADVNGDGVQDLITTVSNRQLGSRIRAYLFTDNGTLTVEGPPIGMGNRWQHQLAWAAFAPDGTFELVEVLTPHIGGVVRFYQFTGTSLEIVAELRGYTSHVIGSRNLDLAVAGDFNGDGLPELALPSQDLTRIAGIQRTATGAEVVWELPLAAPLATNLAAYQTDTGLALAAGTQLSDLRVWQSQP